METMCPEQSSLGLTASHDLYEVRPRKDREGIDLISELFRYGPIWYAGPDAVRNAMAYAKYRSDFRSAAGNYPRVGRLRLCSPDARIERCLRRGQPNSRDILPNVVISCAVFACAFKTPCIASPVPGGNQDAKMDRLLQCDRTCGHISIVISRGFRYGMGSNGSTASAAAI